MFGRAVWCGPGCVRGMSGDRTDFPCSFSGLTSGLGQVNSVVTGCGWRAVGSMSIASDKFKFADVARIYHESREVSRHRRAPSKGGVARATVTCKGCGKCWRALGFKGGMCGMIVTCPFCGAEEMVPITVFDRRG